MPHLRMKKPLRCSLPHPDRADNPKRQHRCGPCPSLESFPVVAHESPGAPRQAASQPREHSRLERKPERLVPVRVVRRASQQVDGFLHRFHLRRLRGQSFVRETAFRFPRPSDARALRRQACKHCDSSLSQAVESRLTSGTIRHRCSRQQLAIDENETRENRITLIWVEVDAELCNRPTPRSREPTLECRVSLLLAHDALWHRPSIAARRGRQATRFPHPDPAGALCPVSKATQEAPRPAARSRPQPSSSGETTQTNDHPNSRKGQRQLTYVSACIQNRNNGAIKTRIEGPSLNRKVLDTRFRVCILTTCVALD